MENKIRAVLLTTAGVLTAMLFWSWKHRPPEAVLVRTAAAETQDIYNSVTIFGTVESAESTAVCPAKNGVVSAVYAATGDTVQKGDTLCTLTDIGRSQTAADYWQTAQKRVCNFRHGEHCHRRGRSCAVCADGRYCADRSAGGRECIGRYAVHTNCESG